MSALGDLLELMQTARHRYTTLAATIHWWIDDEREAVVRLWIERPNRIRQESEVARGFRDESFVAIATARGTQTYWPNRPNWGAVRSRSRDQFTVVDDMLDPSRLLPLFDFSPTGRAVVAGRRGIVARAERRSPGASILARSAREHELVVDAERGILLRVQTQQRVTVATADVETVAFDEPLPARIFSFRLPRGISPRREPPWFTSYDLTPRGDAGQIAQTAG